jgi:outer membrane protein assembly factor BamB
MIQALPLLVLLAFADPIVDQSWLQWGGPAHDFHVPAAGLHWSGEAPRRAWERELGEGYSAIIGDGRTLYAAFRRDDTMVVAALDAATGRTRWQQPMADTPRPGMFLDYGRGPNSTPALVGNRLFVVSFTGQLAAMDPSTGRTLWRKELWQELRGTFRDVGYSNSPLPYRDLLILPVGGKGRALVAFRQQDGGVAWSAGDLENAMSSPILIDLDGERQLVALMVEGLAGFDPQTGRQLWFHPHRTQYDVNATTPVWHAASRTLVVSSAYDGGARAIRLDRSAGRTSASEAWFNRRLRVHHGNMLLIDDHLFASSGDFGPAPLTAIEVRTGRVVWQQRTFPKVTMVQAGERTVILDEDGRLAIATLSPSGLNVLQQAPITTKLSWTAPTLIGRTLYVRDRRSLVALALE